MLHDKGTFAVEEWRWTTLKDHRGREFVHEISGKRRSKKAKRVCYISMPKRQDRRDLLYLSVSKNTKYTQILLYLHYNTISYMTASHSPTTFTLLLSYSDIYSASWMVLQANFFWRYFYNITCSLRVLVPRLIWCALGFCVPIWRRNVR